ncbi:MAG: hypothetical protein HY200_10040 [Nitrospirae bacterium]|nr:hypothetical protein [Nitrospirota bacterium]MBI3595285.1 hypothetical protein [Nitrospirota bacterium]
MSPIEMNNPDEIEKLLSHIALKGKGFTTECLMAEVLEAGLSYPDFLKASGEDPLAEYEGKSPAWATYHVRQGKRVFMVYGDGMSGRRTHYSETP